MSNNHAPKAKSLPEVNAQVENLLNSAPDLTFAGFIAFMETQGAVAGTGDVSLLSVYERAWMLGRHGEVTQLEQAKAGYAAYIRARNASRGILNAPLKDDDAPQVSKLFSVIKCSIKTSMPADFIKLVQSAHAGLVVPDKVRKPSLTEAIVSMCTKHASLDRVMSRDEMIKALTPKAKTPETDMEKLEGLLADVGKLMDGKSAPAIEGLESVKAAVQARIDREVTAAAVRTVHAAGLKIIDPNAKPDPIIETAPPVPPDNKHASGSAS